LRNKQVLNTAPYRGLINHNNSDASKVIPSLLAVSLVIHTITARRLT